MEQVLTADHISKTFTTGSGARVTALDMGFQWIEKRRYAWRRLAR